MKLYHAHLYRLNMLSDVRAQEHSVFYAKDDDEAVEKIKEYAHGKDFWIQSIKRVTDDPFGKPVYFEPRPMHGKTRCTVKL